MTDRSTRQLSTMVDQSVDTENLKKTEGSGSGVMGFLVRGNGIVPPWWSRARDRELRRFWPQCDHLAGAIYAMVSRITTMNFMVVPVYPNIDRHVEQAQWFQENLLTVSEYMKGWNVAISKFLNDVLTQDNGGFMQIIAEGRIDQPIPIGRSPLGITHLDSSRCTRTPNPMYPIIYEDLYGMRYKLHWTRVMEHSSMASPRLDMNGVGICAVSRALNIAQNLYDIAVYKQEKLGSRPLRAIAVGSKISTEQMYEAVKMAGSDMDQQSFRRFAKIVFVGNEYDDVGIDLVDLASLPDGFDEDVSIRWGVAAIALALGVDFRELWPATVTGATKADASIQHLKAKGKGIGELILLLERMISQKFLPGHLKLRFDVQDDEQDALRADIMSARSDAYGKMTDTGALNKRIIHEMMLSDGAISREQFTTMELEEGRLPSGAPVLSLFMIDDPGMRVLLDIGVANPLDVRTHTGNEQLLAKIDQKYIDAMAINAESSRQRAREDARAAMAALRELHNLYSSGVMGIIEAEKLMEEESGNKPLAIGDELTTEDKPVQVDNDKE